MNLKRLIIAGVTLLCFALTGSAEIALKDVGGGNVEITFKFKDKSPEMGVIGTFDNWTVPGEAMTLGDDGVWTKTITASATDEIQYKFYSKGNWIFDEMSPDKKDDGYGGKNGLIVVADILSGVTPAVPGAAPLPPPKGKAVKNARPKAAFGTTTYLQSTTDFTSALAPVKSTVDAKSTWRFIGDLQPNLTGHVELTAFNGSSTVMNNLSGSTVPFEDGIQKLFSGFLFNPFYYLGGDKRPVLDQFAFGFDTPVVAYENGYFNAKLPAHRSILWNTVSENNLANAGYSAWTLGPALRTIGDFTLTGAFVPNKSQTSDFGLYSWVSLDGGSFRLEVQSDMKALSTDPLHYFEGAKRSDFIWGAEGYMDGFQLQVQSLSATFFPGGAIDSLDAAEKSALKVVFGYRDYDDNGQALFTYASRGSVAQFMYGDSNAELGPVSTQTFAFSGYQRFGYVETLKLDASAALTKNNDDTRDTAIVVKPALVVNFGSIPLFPATLEVYGRLVSSIPASGTTTFDLGSVGAKLAFTDVAPGVAEADLYYKLDNSVAGQNLQTLLADAKLFDNLSVQAGAGLRTGTGVTEPLAFSAGLSYRVDAPEFKTPTLYAQFVDNLDPYTALGATASPPQSQAVYYDGAQKTALGQSTYDLADFGPSHTLSGSSLRVGLAWNF